MGRKLWLTTSAAVLLWAGAAQAQDAAPQQNEDQEATVVGEVLVTAERRTTNLQETAVAATVLSAGSAARCNAHN